jgi:predicted dehydrogenase
VRIGIVGCGKIADGHVEEIQKLSTVQLVAVCDLEPIMAKQLAVRYKIPRCYSSFDEMLSREALDVIHITTPPQYHLPLARMAAAAGCHALVEKPLALTYSDARCLIDAMERAGRKLTINYWPNFERLAFDLREIVASGVLGDPVHVESYLGYNLAGAFGQALLGDMDHWIHKLPGKLFQNNLDHVLNKIVPFLPDGNIELHATAFRRRPLSACSTNDMLDELRVVIRAGSVSAYATFCSHVRPVAHFLRVYGTKNTVHLDFNARTIVLEADQIVPSALGRLLPAYRQSRSYMRQAIINLKEFACYQFQYFAGMNRLFREFYACIADNRPVPIPYSQMLRVSWMMDEIIQDLYPG